MVKKVFPILLGYVFVTTQCWAISGGPNYGSGKISPVGLYSGTIAGLTESDVTTAQPSIPGDNLPTPSSTTTTNSNALGLFDLAVPANGTATGGFLLFAEGTVFAGTIDGSVDPDTDVLKGIVQSSFTVTLTDASTSATVTETAVGIITAKISGTKPTSTVAARLTGTASLDVNFGTYDPTTLEPIVNRVITFSVSGVKQSADPTSSTSSLTATTTTG